jgi:hypothetical protein
LRSWTFGESERGPVFAVEMIETVDAGHLSVRRDALTKRDIRGHEMAPASDVSTAIQNATHHSMQVTTDMGRAILSRRSPPCNLLQTPV